MRYNTETEVSQTEKVPKGVYTKEFNEEAVKLVTELGLSIPEVARRLSMGKSTIKYWGGKGTLHKDKNPLTFPSCGAIISLCWRHVGNHRGL